MKKEIVKIVFDRRKQLKRTGTGDVEIYMGISTKCKKYIKLESITEKQFNKNHDSGYYNVYLEKYLAIANAMTALGEELTLENLNQRLGIQSKPKKLEDQNNVDVIASASFTDWMYEEISHSKTRESTKEHEYTTWKTLVEWGKMTRFEQLTPQNVYKFDRYLEEGNRGQTTRYNYHKHIIKYINIAIRLGLLNENPYMKCDIKKGRYKERTPLTEEEMLKIREIPLKGPLDTVRNMFVFAAYTGLAYCDVKRFNYETMTDEVDGIHYIDGKRLKTGTSFYTPILQPAMDILIQNDYKIRCITNEKANMYLKTIQALCGINKNLTFHLARHSFATLALAHGASIENVSRMLGHTNIRTTQIYTKILKKTIESQSKMLALSIR